MHRVIPVFVIACALLFARAAVADEFDTIPLTDPVYTHLSTLQQAGWLAERDKSPALARQPFSRKPLTRYEVALEAARAIFTLNSRFRGDEQAVPSAARHAIRAVRDLTTTMRNELEGLKVDTDATLKLCDALNNPQLNRTPVDGGASRVTAPAKSAGKSPLSRSAVQDGSVRKAAEPKTNASMFPAAPGSVAESRMELPVSQRVRLYSVISTLARDAQDPLTESRSVWSSPAHRSQPDASIAGAGASLQVTPGISVRAGREYHSQRTLQWKSPLNDAARLNSTGAHESVAGIDVKTPISGIVLRSNWASIRTDDRLAAKRFQAALGYTGWQNKLALSANITRLVPEDRAPFSALTRTTAGNLNIAVEVTNHISLNLLYEQLFGADDQVHADRAVAGGLSIRF